MGYNSSSGFSGSPKSSHWLRRSCCRSAVYTPHPVTWVAHTSFPFYTPFTPWCCLSCLLHFRHPPEPPPHHSLHICHAPLGCPLSLVKASWEPASIHTLRAEVCPWYFRPTNACLILAVVYVLLRLKASFHMAVPHWPPGHIC